MRYQREDACRAWLTYGELKPGAIEKLLYECGSYERIYDDFIRSRGLLLDRFTNEMQENILRCRASNEMMHSMLVSMRRHEMKVLAKGDAAYPEMLLEIPDAPPVLFYIGDLSCLQGRCVTMIGSRSATAGGVQATRTVARELSASGVRIVSGLAHGIDTAAHEGCLEGGSPTVGVAASGLDVDYPAGNAGLKRQIVERGGVLLSEYPPGIKALKWHFPVRNRILSGLSSATILMEARLRSGSMTTVQHALDQGREVYAYPGNAGSVMSEASHQILREGANFFSSAQDILEDMKWDKPRAAEKKAAPELKQKQNPSPVSLTPEQSKVLGALEAGEKSYDQLAELTGLDAPVLSVTLTMMQIEGMILPLPGKQYRKA